MATGGYDYTFAETVRNTYKCEHCHKVLKAPHLIQCCGKRSCESCLQGLLQQRGHRKCPFCGKTTRRGFLHIVDRPHAQDVNELMIYCTNHKEGCGVILPLQTLQTHLDRQNAEGCGYIKVRCTNKCGEQFYRKDLQNHLQNECRLREYTCQHKGCGYRDTYEKVMGEHQETCEHRPFDCPNRCGRRQIKRKDIPAHREECRKQPVDCPYRPAGCNVPLVREDVQRHLESSRDTHSLQLMGAITTLTSGIQAELTTLKSGLRDKATTASLSCIETHLRLGKRILQKRGDTISERMTSISEYKGSGKIWYSPPFYYMDGYKMQLAVRIGAQMHINVALFLLKGEYDDRLKWPIAANILSREQQERAARRRGRNQSAPPQHQPQTICKLVAIASQLRTKPPLRKAVISTALDELHLSQTLIDDLERNIDVLPIIVDFVSPTDTCQNTGFACWPFGVTRVTGDSDSRPMPIQERFESRLSEVNALNYLHNDSLVFDILVV